MPSASYKVKTEWLKDGCICVNVAADKNFEKNVQDKVGMDFRYFYLQGHLVVQQASIYIPAVGKVTILMLLRNL